MFFEVSENIKLGHFIDPDSTRYLNRKIKQENRN